MPTSTGTSVTTPYGEMPVHVDRETRPRIVADVAVAGIPNAPGPRACREASRVRQLARVVGAVEGEIATDQQRRIGFTDAVGDGVPVGPCLRRAA